MLCKGTGRRATNYVFFHFVRRWKYGEIQGLTMRQWRAISTPRAGYALVNAHGAVLQRRSCGGVLLAGSVFPKGWRLNARKLVTELRISDYHIQLSTREP